MDKLVAQQKIRALIDKYQRALSSGQLKKYSEEDTKKDFILQLFDALGWDVSERQEVSSEEHIRSSGFVDYGFYLKGRPKFYLEAKPFKVDIHKEDFAHQAIRYSWNKGVTWAVLTNFERVIVFNAQAVEQSLSGKRYFEIPYSDYLERFDQLWLLSREAFEKDLIDQEAEKVSKKLQKVSVTASLYKDLNNCRDLLTQELAAQNPGLNRELLDEGVQRLLDRLIFLRVAEDRKIEPPTLIPLIREWESNPKRNEIQLYRSMVDKFKELDETYDSNLFNRHPFEEWEDYSGTTEKVVNILYGKKDYYEYDFKVMPADILGTVYENYLGYRLSQAKHKKGVLLKTENVAIVKDAKKRKEQGIYYTPSFIVDYIVRHALQPTLDKCKTVNELLKIKVLDPACGSGSFLIKALEVFAEKYSQISGQPNDERIKIDIIMNNLYGVDLDEQAVEIARLNLLIAALDRRGKLPQISNIKCGNSLISGTDAELKKHFGVNFRDKKPFNWQEEFPSVFAQGGFDVVIGNPPYVSSREFDAGDKVYFENSYQSAKDQYDLYALFIERGIGQLKNEGQLGFIIPNKFLITKYGLALRKFIFENTTLVNFQDYSHDDVFPDASVYPVVIILKREKDRKDVISENYDLLKEFGFGEVDSVMTKLDAVNNVVDLNVWRPLATTKNIIDGKNIIISNREVSRYSFDTDYLGDLSARREYDIVKDKIIMKKLCYNLEASLDEDGFYPVNTTYCITTQESKKLNLKYVLGVLNSKLLSYYVRRKYAETALRGGFIELRVFQIERLPILDAHQDKQKNITSLVDRMLAIQKQLHATEENSNEWESLKLEIEKTDKKIDAEVYKLYDLTPEEIKIIEG